jgi:ribosomal-protein-alanine N-acetyltransferase
MLVFNFNPFPTFATHRLQLRQFVPGDLQDFFNLRANEEVNRYIDRPIEKIERTEDILRKIILNVESNQSIMWVIALKDDPKLIGTIGFWRIEPENHRAETGYNLMPQFWNKGLVSEAMQVVLDYGFDVMNLHSVVAHVNPNNAASIRLLEKFGFVREGYFRESYYFDGKFMDEAVYSLVGE